MSSSSFALRLSNGSTAIEGRGSAIVAAGSLEAAGVVVATLWLARAVIAPEQPAADQEQQRDDGELDASDPLLAAVAVVPGEHQHDGQSE